MKQTNTFDESETNVGFMSDRASIRLDGKLSRGLTVNLCQEVKKAAWGSDITISGETRRERWGGENLIVQTGTFKFIFSKFVLS